MKKYLLLTTLLLSISAFATQIPSLTTCNGQIVTGGNVSLKNTDPTPIMIKLNGTAEQGVFKTKALNNCQILASGFYNGNRTQIRLNKISCIQSNNKILDKKVQGWVADQDNKNGLIGKTLKPGQKLTVIFDNGFNI